MKLITLPEIALRLGKPVHRVRYLVQTNAIDPVYRNGQIQLFMPDVLNQIRGLLTQDRRRKEAK